MWVYICVCMCVFVYVRICFCVLVCVYVYMYVCVCVRVCLCAVSAHCWGEDEPHTIMWRRAFNRLAAGIAMASVIPRPRREPSAFNSVRWCALHT